jgi:hypothetical protein
VQVSPLRKALRFLHPSCIPNLLRFAVNQQGCKAAEVLVRHLRITPQQLLDTLKQPLMAAAHNLQLQQQEQAQQQAQQQQQQQQQQQDAASRHILQVHALQQQQVTADLLNELLLLAAKRQQFSLVLDLLLLQKTRQLQITSSTVASLLHSVLSTEHKPSAGLAPYLHQSLLEMLCALPAAETLDAAQVCKLLLTAIQHQEGSAVSKLCALPGASQLSSDQANSVGLEAVQLGSFSAIDSLHSIIVLLQPEHLVLLLQRAMLLATLAGEFTPKPWCDVRMRKHGIEVPASPWSRCTCIVEELCYVAAAQEQQQLQLQKPHIDEVLLTAAALGNADVVRTLFECLELDDKAGGGAESDWQPSAEAALQLLETSLQLRNSTMLKTVLYHCERLLAYGYSEAMLEVTTALIRTDDRQLLMQMSAALAGWMYHDLFAEEDLPKLLQVAVQLGRTGVLRELCGNSGRPYWIQPERQLRVIGRVSQEDYEGLIKQAVRSNSSSMVQCLMGLPPASNIQGGVLQLVMEECRRQGQQVGSIGRHVKTGWLWPLQQQQPKQHGVLQTPGQQQCACGLRQCEQDHHHHHHHHQQQQQRVGDHDEQDRQADHQQCTGEADPAEMQGQQQQQQQQDEMHQHGDRQQLHIGDMAQADGQQQQQRRLPLVVEEPLMLLLQAGQLPNAAARSKLPSGPAIDESLLDEEEDDVLCDSRDAVRALLSAALLMPPGVQQEAWVALLSNSRVGVHLSWEDQMYLLVAAVHTAHSSCCNQPLRLMYIAWEHEIGAHIMFRVLAAAVQLGCLPALQLLLNTPAAACQSPGQVAELLRWAICSNSSSERSQGLRHSRRAARGSDCGNMQPVIPTYTAAHAAVFAALCQLPAAQQVGCYSLVGLFVRAMQQGNVEAVQQLCKLAGAQQLDGDCVRGLLRWARVVGSRPGRDAVVGALCGLRGARGLSVADVDTLLQLYDRIDDMMGWSAAESEQAGVVPAEMHLGVA